MTCPLAKPAGPRPPGQSSCATPCCLAGCRPRLQGAALGHPQSQATRSSALGPQRCRYRRHGSPAPGGATSSHNAGRLEAEKCDSDAPVYRCRGAYATASRCLSMTSPKLFCTPDHTRSTRISHERLTAHSIIRSNGRRRTWYFPSQTSASSCLTADWPRLTSEITSSSLEYACSLRRCSLRSVPRIRCSCLDVFNSTTCKEQNAGNQQHVGTAAAACNERLPRYAAQRVALSLPELRALPWFYPARPSAYPCGAALHPHQRLLPPAQPAVSSPPSSTAQACALICVSSPGLHGSS